MFRDSFDHYHILSPYKVFTDGQPRLWSAREDKAWYLLLVMILTALPWIFCKVLNQLSEQLSPVGAAAAQMWLDNASVYLTSISRR